MFGQLVTRRQPGSVLRPEGSSLSVGRFAVKKIAVGQSSSYLLRISCEDHLLETLVTLHHPNIVTNHHPWSNSPSFGPKIPTLLYALLRMEYVHVLSQYLDAVG